MKFEEELVGKVIYHKLLGKCIITKADDQKKDQVYEPKWEIRDTKGMILTVDRRELEEYPSKALRLRYYANTLKQVSKIIEAEAKTLEDETEDQNDR